MEKNLIDKKVNEICVIGNMLLRAKKAGMMIEVVKWFGDRREAGDDVLKAARFALYEWDC